ncbi:MAG TPA: arylsulfatase [Opitutae bacterium]|nr:arylsulfatase [Opitutae bacterium]
MISLQRTYTFSAIAISSFMALCHVLSADRPNVLLIMADDLGYSDLGAYGGEIETPNLDRLAAGGLQFSQFRATPMCSTTRVALMAGMSYAAAGNGNYKDALPLPTLMKNAGYRTMMAGKWHAGNANPRDPKLFDRFFGFLGGMTDCYVGGADWYDGQQKFNNFKPGFDATTEFTARSIEFMQEAVAQEQPFFMFVSYNAPHHPLQAQKVTVDKYIGRYMDGYAVVRAARHAKQLELGLVDPNWVPAPHGVEVRLWDELPHHRKVVEDARMAAYAAMVDEMDQGIGRLIEYLEKSGQLDNTLILFMSDNGGDYNNGSIQTDAQQIPWLPGNNPTSSNGWAWVKNTPFNFYKHASHEGAITLPFIAHWPKQIKGRDGEINHVAIAVTDIYPTMLQLAGAEYPQKERCLKPLTGRSFVNVLTKQADFDAPSRFLWFNQSRAWIEDDMKLVSYYDGPWKLYDLEADRTEQNDLSAERSQRAEEFENKWHSYAKMIDMSPALRQPVLKQQHAWGWHRLKMFAPRLLATFPANSKLTAPGSTQLEMRFSAAVDLSGRQGKYVRLFKVSDESQPVWESDPDETHPSHGKRSLKFTDLPPLEPDTQYYVWIDGGAFKVGGKSVGIINDGAYWWRFRTEKN